MADTTVQRKAETWVVREELPKIYGQPFSKEAVKLAWGGSFEFDAVSADRKTVACVSTSCSRTASGGLAYGKLNKIRADALYLLNAQGVERRLLVFTDKDMTKYFDQQRTRGRFPPDSLIEMLFIQLPDSLAAELNQARQVASAEVSPRAE